MTEVARHKEDEVNAEIDKFSELPDSPPVRRIRLTCVGKQLAEEGWILPGFVQREFEDYLKCRSLEHGFIPGVLPSTPPEPAFGCSNTLQTYLSKGTVRELPRRTPGRI